MKREEINIGESRYGSPLSDQEMTVDAVIPSYYPDGKLLCLLEKLSVQTHPVRRIHLINTEEAGFGAFLEKNGLTGEIFASRFPMAEVRHIRAEEFDHGATRSLGVQLSEGADAVLMMTQDAVPADDELVVALLRGLTGTEVSHAPAGEREGKQEGDAKACPVIAAVYARQLPAEDAGAAERYTRTFNYPDQPRFKTEADAASLGIKTYFCSNVCALWRRDAVLEAGLFPSPMIFNEDMVLAGRLLQMGYAIRYTPEARVIHSHNYTASQQFHRNFDLGVSQADHPEIFARFPSEGEGVRYVKAVISYLWQSREGKEILPFVWRCAARLAGFRLGKSYQKLPRGLVLRCTGSRNYWK